MTHEVYKRASTSSDFKSSFEKLNADLATAANGYAGGDLEDQRFSVVHQLSSIFEFLVGQGINPLSLEPMMRPIDALKNQYVNRLDPMFCERRRAGKPEMSEDQINRVGTLAALANAWLALKLGGSDTNIQLAAAAQRFRGQWFGRVTVAQLKRARMIVSQESEDHPAVQTAQTVAGFIDRMILENGRGTAMDVVIRHLNEQPPSPALGNWGSIKGE